MICVGVLRQHPRGPRRREWGSKYKVRERSFLEATRSEEREEPKPGGLLALRAARVKPLSPDVNRAPFLRTIRDRFPIEAESLLSPAPWGRAFDWDEARVRFWMLAHGSPAR